MFCFNSLSAGVSLTFDLLTQLTGAKQVHRRSPFFPPAGSVNAVQTFYNGPVGATCGSSVVQQKWLSLYSGHFYLQRLSAAVLSLSWHDAVLRLPGFGFLNGNLTLTSLVVFLFLLQCHHGSKPISTRPELRRFRSFFADGMFLISAKVNNGCITCFFGKILQNNLNSWCERETVSPQTS